MIRLSRWKVVLVLAAALFGLLFTLPNLVPGGVLPSWLPHQRLNLGLDLQGGSYLLLEVDTAALKAEKLNSLAEDLRTSLRGGGITFTNLGVVNGHVQTRVDPSNVSTAVEDINKLNPYQQNGQRSFDVHSQSDGTLTISIPDHSLTQESVEAVRQSIGIVRRRIDQLGTKEPSIVQQGATRIVVEAPGESDPERLQRVIGQTAKLTFQMVDANVTLDERKAGQVPPEDIVLPIDSPEDGGSLAVQRRALVTGEMLQDAQGQASQDTGQPVVSFRFNSVGARRFADATIPNVGKRFAIVLDNKIISAPVIQTAITAGNGQISGNFTTQSASDLALVLRSGALPAPLKVIDQRTVGAELGADAIHAGQVSLTLGAVLIFVFVILAYGMFGGFAAIALVVNGLLIIAFMSLTQATLTLPGIAGLILTLAVAVDANVLIYERARDEARAGRAPMAAMDAGYSKAMSTIIDANLTSLIAALIMFQFGSGPVKGFAWTLSIGIVTSVFTSVLITQVLIGWWLVSAKPKKLPISEVAAR